jgi:hypothetical protein
MVVGWHRQDLDHPIRKLDQISRLIGQSKILRRAPSRRKCVPMAGPQYDCAGIILCWPDAAAQRSLGNAARRRPRCAGRSRSSAMVLPRGTFHNFSAAGRSVAGARQGYGRAPADDGIGQPLRGRPSLLMLNAKKMVTYSCHHCFDILFPWSWNI